MGLEGSLGIRLLASTFDPSQHCHGEDPKDKKVDFVLFNKWLKANTEHAYQRLDLRLHTRDIAVVYFLAAFWLRTIEGCVGFQFFCICRCVGPALQRSSSSGCERNLHRRRAENGDINLRNILRIATHDPGRLRRTMTRVSRSSAFATSSAVGAVGKTSSSTELWRVSRRCFQKM